MSLQQNKKTIKQKKSLQKIKTIKKVLVKEVPAKKTETSQSTVIEFVFDDINIHTSVATAYEIVAELKKIL
jgi:hypothetical protein